MARAENVHPEDFDRCLQTYVSNFDARRSFEMEYRMRHHTGQYRWILDRGVPRYAPDGTFEGYVGGCLDIHGQKQAAEKVRIADDMTRLMNAQDEERRRIARELHDSAGQTLTVLGLSLAQLVERAEAIAQNWLKTEKRSRAWCNNYSAKFEQPHISCIRPYWTNAVSGPQFTCT